MKALMDNLKEQVTNLGQGLKAILMEIGGKNPRKKIVFATSEYFDRKVRTEQIKMAMIKKGQRFMLQLRNVIRGARFLVVDQKGQTALDQVIAILISLVLGALLLAGLYALFGDVVLPLLKERILNMFDYAG